MSELNSDNRKVVIELKDVYRDFHVGDETVHALRGVSLRFTKASLLPLWASLVPASQRFLISWDASILLVVANTILTEFRYAR